MAAAAATNGPDAAAKRPTVLVVEDEVLIRLMIADNLRTEGLTVIEAANADEALTILRSDIAVHLLFTDVAMPGSMDGLGLAEHARAMRPELKILVTSGRAPKWPTRNVADGFFGKPYDVARVVERITALLGTAEE
jgi:two-component system, response regulator PdtaR